MNGLGMRLGAQGQKNGLCGAQEEVGELVLFRASQLGGSKRAGIIPSHHCTMCVHMQCVCVCVCVCVCTRVCAHVHACACPLRVYPCVLLCTHHVAATMRGEGSNRGPAYAREELICSTKCSHSTNLK